MRFVISLITVDNDYQIEQALTAKKKASELDVDIEILYADSDPITQSQQLLNVIQSGPRLHPAAIVVEPVSGTAMPQVALAAAKAGIGWVVLNRDAGYISELRKTYRVPLFCVASDNKMIGRMQGEQTARLLPNGGSVLYVQGPSDSAVAAHRTTGMHETKGAAEVRLLRASWTEVSSYKAINLWLRLSTSRESNVQVVAAQNDAMAMGARRALTELSERSGQQRWSNVAYLGADGVRNAGFVWVQRGLLAATVIVPPNASKAMEMLAHCLKTGIVPPEMTTIEPRAYPSCGQLSPISASKGGLVHHA